jgi:hypothetical protein
MEMTPAMMGIMKRGEFDQITECEQRAMEAQAYPFCLPQKLGPSVQESRVARNPK